MRTRTWLAVAAVMIGVAVPAAAAPVGAAFTGGTGSTSSYAADTLDPPTGVAGSHACTRTAPVLVATRTATATATSISVPRPSEVLAGDVVIVMVMHHDSSSEPQPRGTDGWQRTSQASGSSQGRGTMVVKVAGSSEPTSYLFTGLDSSDATGALLLVYRGVDPAQPFAAEPQTYLNQTGSTTVRAGSVSTSIAPTLLVAGLLVDDYSGAVSTPTGATRAAEVVASAPQPVSMLAVHRTLAATGSSGETSATIASSKKAYGFSLALSSAPPSLAVTLTWTPTADTYATGYEGYRSDNPTVIGLGSPRTLSSYTDTTLGSAGATYYVRSVAGSWRSSWVSVAVPACA